MMLLKIYKQWLKIDKKLSDTSKFIVTENFKRLTKINFNARLTKSLINYTAR